MGFELGQAIENALRTEVTTQMKQYVARIERLEEEVKIYKRAVVQLEQELTRHIIKYHLNITGDDENGE